MSAEVVRNGNTRNTVAAELGAVIMGCNVDQDSALTRLYGEAKGEQIFPVQNMDETCFSGAQGDWVMTRVGYVDDYVHGGSISVDMNDTQSEEHKPLIITSLNGFTKEPGTSDEIAISNLMRDYRFLGVLLRQYNFHIKENSTLNDLATNVQVEGVLTCINRAKVPIYAGDFVRPYIAHPSELNLFAKSLNGNGNQFKRIPVMMEPIRKETSYLTFTDVLNFVDPNSNHRHSSTDSKALAIKGIVECVLDLKAEIVYDDQRKRYAFSGDNLNDIKKKAAHVGRMIRGIVSHMTLINHQARMIALTTSNPGEEADFYIMQ